MQSTLTSYRTRADRLLTQYEYAQETIRKERKALSESKESVSRITEAQRVLQHVAQAVQQEAHHRIASVVTKCLRSVFAEDAYEFKIEFERKRGRTEAKMTFVREGVEVDPLTAAGGGVVNVAAFALRLACIILARPPKRRLLVLDEPFGHLSREYVPLVGEMLNQLSQELDVQIILTTHNEELQIGEVMKL